MDLVELAVNGSLSFYVLAVLPNDQVVRRLGALVVGVVTVAK
jgi:hypothetical protein